jgi:hypothetical protein
MSRLFTFGCSFTNYQWPTWADILGKEFSNFENWGNAGSGNHYIYNALVECHLKNYITKDDTVYIMWSSTGREDRYVNRKWLTPGNIWNSNLYQKSFVDKFVDSRGFILRDLALIYGSKSLLDQIGCHYGFFAMVPISQPNDYHPDTIEDDISDVIPYYATMLKKIHPSIFEVVFDYDWDSRPFIINGKKSWWQGWYDRIKDPSWPDLVDKKTYQTLSVRIKQECEEVFGFFIPNPDNPNSRVDYHPTPAEHLEYLDRVFQENKISSTTREWIAECDEIVRGGKWIPYQKQPIQRW